MSCFEFHSATVEQRGCCNGKIEIEILKFLKKFFCQNILSQTQHPLHFFALLQILPPPPPKKNMFISMGKNMISPEFQMWKEPLIWTDVKVQPSGRLEESDVGVGGLHFGWIFLYLLQLVSNLITVLFQASI